MNSSQNINLYLHNYCYVEKINYISNRSIFCLNQNSSFDVDIDTFVLNEELFISNRFRDLVTKRVFINGKAQALNSISQKGVELNIKTTVLKTFENQINNFNDEVYNIGDIFFKTNLVTLNGNNNNDDDDDDFGSKKKNFLNYELNSASDTELDLDSDFDAYDNNLKSESDSASGTELDLDNNFNDYSNKKSKNIKLSQMLNIKEKKNNNIKKNKDSNIEQTSFVKLNSIKAIKVKKKIKTEVFSDFNDKVKEND